MLILNLRSFSTIIKRLSYIIFVTGFRRNTVVRFKKTLLSQAMKFVCFSNVTLATQNIKLRMRILTKRQGALQ